MGGGVRDELIPDGCFRLRLGHGGCMRVSLVVESKLVIMSKAPGSLKLSSCVDAASSSCDFAHSVELLSATQSTEHDREDKHILAA